MGKVLTLLVVFLAVLVGVTLYLCPCLLKDPEVPVLPSHRWWGPGNEPPGGSEAAANIRPFRIQVPDEVLSDLKARLGNARLSAPLEGATFQYGFNTDYLRSVLDYWLNKYDWRKEETRLNQFPQFLVKIGGIDVHFIHVKPTVKDKKVQILPLLMIHGWPGSVVEFYKAIPLLTSGVGGVAFEVICPSIPGFGFSEAPHHPGFSAVEAARTFKKLMEALGHHQFYVQGGDWGSAIGSMMSVFYPEMVRGLHLNFSPMLSGGGMSIMKYIVAHLAPSLVMEENQKFNIFPFKQFFSNLVLESGYFHIQATKPDTVGVALGDSPVGLAAYILEKFSTATNMDYRDKKDGGLLDKFTLDDLLTNVMVYWVTNTATSSARFYKENMKPSQRVLKLDALPILVPTGIAVFPHEIMTTPRSILSHKYRQILTYNMMKRGGHFAAFEEPQLLSDDFRVFVSACETHLKEQKAKLEAAGVGKSGSTLKKKPASATKKQEQDKTNKRTDTKEGKASTQEAGVKRDKVKTTPEKNRESIDRPATQAPVKLQEQVKTTTTKSDGNVEKSTTPPPPKQDHEVKSTTRKESQTQATQEPPQPTAKVTPKPEVRKDSGNQATQEPPKPTAKATPKPDVTSEKMEKQTPTSPPPKHSAKPAPKEQAKVDSQTVKPEVKVTDQSAKSSTAKTETASDGSSGTQKTKNDATPKGKADNALPTQKPEASTN